MKEIHDEYEIQTIKGNILRHRVSTFKMDFKKEVDGKCQVTCLTCEINCV